MIDPSLVGTILGVLSTIALGLLTYKANRDKDKNEKTYQEINRVREDLEDRDKVYRDMVTEIHVLNAWIFLLTAQLREAGVVPADKPSTPSQK